ncbi:GNAT family N-acetyltransferase [Gemmobacter nectariphilus]|uniref:GNAT family N-acetyltransferase n=1 Tax=Gemmobacter nectariphilus TaxID=220343 RepID=UPI0003FEA57D|nr:GNAT family N-acetyltransferase [Gemmobacter nectariphilus]
MIRHAVPGDEAALTAFLSGHLETSMFLLGNLQAQGLASSDHPHATTYVIDDRGGRIGAVLGLSNNGFLMCQAPGLTPALVHGLLAPLAGRETQGMTGEADQVAVFLDALGVRPRLNRVEPLFALDLARLPETAQPIRPPGPGDVPLLTGWFTGYLAETDSGTPADAALRAEAAVKDSPVRLIERAGRPIAMAAINAAAGDVVQVGGVYTPPALRGQGLAGQAVAALLAEARGKGAARAILFAASDAAAKAYVRIGFRRIGSYRIALWPTACRIEPAA